MSSFNYGLFLKRPLYLKKLELLLVDLPQVEPFQSAVGIRRSRYAMFVKWLDKNGIWGIGECACRPDPYFSHEFLNGAVLLIQEQIAPLLKEEMSYGQLLAVLGKIRGWNFVKAAILDSVHDFWRRSGKGDLIDAWSVPKSDRVPVGISLGMYENSGKLIDKIHESVEKGYHRIKLKIQPGMKPDYLTEVRREFPDLYVGVDANGSFSESEMNELAALARLELAMMEQPFPPDRLDLCAFLKSREPTLRICLDEAVREVGHLHVAHQSKAIDELNLKPGRVGGIPNAIRLAELCEQYEIPVWIGGMFETGVGRAVNLRLARCFPNAKAHDLSPSTRYFEEDLVQEPIEMDARGFIVPPEAPVHLVDMTLEKYLVRELEAWRS